MIECIYIIFQLSLIYPFTPIKIYIYIYIKIKLRHLLLANRMDCMYLFKTIDKESIDSTHDHVGWCVTSTTHQHTFN